MKFMEEINLHDFEQEVRMARECDVHIIYQGEQVSFEVDVLADDIMIDLDENEISIDTGLNEMLDSLCMTLNGNEKIKCYYNDQYYGTGEQKVYDVDDFGMTFYVTVP